MQITGKDLAELLSYFKAPKPIGHILGVTHLLMEKFCEGFEENVNPSELNNAGAEIDSQ
jgi:hypothetical protein